MLQYIVAAMIVALIGIIIGFIKRKWFQELASAKGYAAMGGYQCGVKGAAVVDADALPRDRNGDRGVFPLSDASSAYFMMMRS